jgi:EAL domain-containing protein (putative c-di-GMP-specific phosphodiesterase class I)
MTLVRDVDKDPVRKKLVGLVNEVSRDIGAIVVGEGVETKEERDVLIELGCHLLQGYFFGKPQRVT